MDFLGNQIDAKSYLWKIDACCGHSDESQDQKAGRKNENCDAFDRHH
jgi:hypothetical protein